MSTVTTLYRFWRSDGMLLYVGIAKNPTKRMSQHKAEKPWWTDISNITLQHFDSREEARSAEVHAIKTEKPLYNVSDYEGDHSWWEYLAAREPALKKLEDRIWGDLDLDDALAELERIVGPRRWFGDNYLGSTSEPLRMADALDRQLDVLATVYAHGGAVSPDERVLRSEEALDMAARHVRWLHHSMECRECRSKVSFW